MEEKQQVQQEDPEIGIMENVRWVLCKLTSSDTRNSEKLFRVETI